MQYRENKYIRLLPVILMLSFALTACRWRDDAARQESPRLPQPSETAAVPAEKKTQTSEPAAVPEETLRPGETAQPAETEETERAVEAAAPVRTESAIREAENPTYTVPPETFRPAPVTEPDPASLIGQPLIFEAAGVTIFAESLVKNGNALAFTVSLTNQGAETVHWTFDTVTLDGMTMHVDDGCDVPAGGTILYTYTLNNPLLSFLIGPGEHSVSVRSILTSSDGSVIAEGESDTVAITA